MKKRILSALLCAALLCTGIPSAAMASTGAQEAEASQELSESSTQEVSEDDILEQSESSENVSADSSVDTAEQAQTGTAAQTEGSFILAASTINENLIVPVRVTYSAGDTILSALKKSSYKFEENSSNGFINKIEGVEGNYCIFCSDGGYELNRSPEEIEVVEFTELTEKSDSRTALLKRMVEYQEMTNNVQNYGDAIEAYKNAEKQYKSADEKTAASLLQKLNDAIAAYEKFLQQGTYTVTVNATQDGKTNQNLSLEFTDMYGNVYKEQGNTIQLKPGTYEYWISDGGYNYSSNSLSDSVEVSSDTELNIELPSGEWFGDIYLLQNRTDKDGKKIPFQYQVDEKNHVVECYVDDRAGGKDSVYLYVTPGKDLPKDLKNYDVRYYLEDEHSLAVSNELVSWNSEKNDYGKYRVQTGMGDSQYDVYTRYLGDSSTRQSILFQGYTVKVKKVPTADITIQDQDGNSLIDGFNPAKTDYTVNTIADQINITATPYGTDGYSVSIQNGSEVSEDGNITVKDGENPVTVTVSHTNGNSRTYRFTVNKVKSVETTLKASDGVKVQVFNFNNEEIKPVGGKYLLVPDANYTYIASVDDKYFAKESFSVKADTEKAQVIQVADPEEKDALSEFAMYNGASAKNRLVYEADSEFKKDTHKYSYTISDANSSVYVQATPVSGYKVKAEWTNQSDKKKAEQTSIKEVSSTQTSTLLSHVLESSGYGNQVTIVTYKEVKGVTYYQNYEMNIRRSLHLKDLSASTITGDAKFVDDSGSAKEFDRDLKNYNLVVVSNIDTLNLSGHFMNEASERECDGGYYALINGEKYTDLSNVSLPLDITKKEENIDIQICHASTDAVSNTYRLTVKKRDLANVTFKTDPEDATVFVKNEVDNSTVYPDSEGIYKMMPEVAYTYTVTKSGYKAVEKTGFTVTKDTEVSVTLNQVADNPSIKDLPSEWPSFRDENNNAVLDEKTPVKAEDSVLYWANKDAFDGYCGHPILVNGYLYTYDSKNLLKLDTVTGELVQRGGALVRPSSFSIQPPTYGGGMIFVGLSQGTIQAFNADTMESLWVYQDPLGGQPNCQITYKDGYIYTGFWNNETKEANYVCISTTDEDPLNSTEEKVATWTHTQMGGYYWAGAYVDQSGDFMLEGTDDGEAGYKTGYAHVLSMNPKTGEVIDDLTLPHTGDLRSNITHDTEGDNATGDYYFTTKGGYFYRISVGADGKFDRNSIRWIKLDNGRNNNTAMSTSTPTVYNGRAYVGVSGESQFGQYTGHGIAVLDLTSMTMAYYVPTQGYPQTSGILTKGYENETGKVYIYFFDNFTPGKLRVISDQPGQTAMAEKTEEELYGNVFETGYVLFTPSGAQSQYALCNPIVDEYGTLYFRNDSNYMMALGATITKLEVTKQPDKVDYKEGEKFNSDGMEVTATYSNGKTRDVTKYVTYSEEELTTYDTDFEIRFDHVMYQNKDGQAGVDYTAPTAHVSLNITADPNSGVAVSGTIKSWDENANTTVRLYDSNVSDDDIRNDMRKDIPELATSDLAVMGTVSAEEDGKHFDQTYQFEKVKFGTYKLAIEKKGKYVVKVVPVTVGKEAVTVEAQQLRLYGDVTGDGRVNIYDLTEIKRYTLDESSAMTKGTDDDQKEKYIAANITYFSSKDLKVNIFDLAEIKRYSMDYNSVFDLIP